MGVCGRNKKAASGQETATVCHTVPSAGIIRIRSSGRVVHETPLSPVAPSSRVTFDKIGYLVEVCNQSIYDDVVKTLHLLRCHKFYIITTYSSTPK
jgi:hypothetical protein